MLVSVYRFNPEVDSEPYMQDFSVEIPENRDLMVLDVLSMLKESDDSLSYRRSCREGVCGSDGMNINGKNGLACITPLSTVIKRNKLELRPMPMKFNVSGCESILNILLIFEVPGPQHRPEMLNYSFFTSP